MTNAQAALMAASQTVSSSGYIGRSTDDVVISRANVFLRWLETDGKQPLTGNE